MRQVCARQCRSLCWNLDANRVLPTDTYYNHLEDGIRVREVVGERKLGRQRVVHNICSSCHYCATIVN